MVSPQRIDGSGELTGWAWTKNNFRISHNTTGLARWIYDWELAASPCANSSALYRRRRQRADRKCWHFLAVSHGPTGAGAVGFNRRSYFSFHPHHHAGIGETTAALGCHWRTPGHPRLRERAPTSLLNEVSPPGGGAAISDGTFKDDKVSFSVVREQKGEKLTQKYTGTVSGDTIKGKVETERGGKSRSTDWEAKRQ